MNKLKFVLVFYTFGSSSSVVIYSYTSSPILDTSCSYPTHVVRAFKMPFNTELLLYFNQVKYGIKRRGTVGGNSLLSILWFKRNSFDSCYHWCGGCRGTCTAPASSSSACCTAGCWPPQRRPQGCTGASRPGTGGGGGLR